ncbi:alpha-N-arabinofuranosidase 1 [Lentilactobacillus otakiensis DSM 19908 = JCM 15040]|nr:alpha-N-arabinofuranosidase 1 [Lentilactobacillus otakiensis DSM 19908 = JCM 15040]
MISKIDPRMWGSFTEHLGRSIYEGIYQPDHPTADKDGFRTDVIDAVKKLNVPLIRYPGGNFVSAYNWEDGIGPKDKRPTKLDLAWRSKETNQFGIHEFMKWAKKVGSEPDMAVNLGTRGIDAARNLIEYCNFPKGTYWSDLRRKNGAEKPFNIKVWSLGNEMDGPWQIGHKTAYEYGRLAHETAKAMRLIDPDIELIACGSSSHQINTFGTWEETLLDQAYDDVDYLSLHQYYDDSDHDLGEFLGKSVDFDHFITDVANICDAVKARRHSKKQINLSIDEWNVWYHSKAADDKQAPWQVAPHLLEDHYNFMDALLVGSLAITLMKHADRVKIGCLAQLINVIAPIMTNTNGDPSVWYQSIFYPFMQASNFGRGIALAAKSDVPTYQAKDYEVPYTDSVATYDENGILTMFIVNKSKEKVDFESTLQNFDVQGLDKATQFCGYDLMKTNEDQSMKLESMNQVTVSDDKVSAELQPLSWNVIRVKVKD